MKLYLQKSHLTHTEVFIQPSAIGTTWKNLDLNLHIHAMFFEPVYLCLDNEISRSFSPMPLTKHRRLTRINMDEVTLSHNMRGGLSKVIQQVGLLQSSGISHASQHLEIC